MHETSIALRILEIVEKKAREEGSSRVNEIELEIGELSGVVAEALEFALEAAVENEAIGKPVIRIDTIQGLARCRTCGHSYHTSDYFSCCPNCGDTDIEIEKGRELRVKSIVVA